MNGEATHEWRLAELEKRMNRLEGWIIKGVLAALANLVALGTLLFQAFLGKG